MPLGPGGIAPPVELRCMICTMPIPEERLKPKVVTCGEDACVREFRNRQRNLTNRKKCLHCLRPSTLADRRAFRRFREVEEKRPDLIYPEAFARFQRSPSTEETPDRGPEAFRGWWLARIGAEEAQNA